jgi:ketosteroid isomerase-like protein
MRSRPNGGSAIVSDRPRGNVALVRDGFARFMRGDIEWVRRNTHPDAVTRRAPPLPDARTYHGFDGLIQAYTDWTAEFEGFDMATGEFIDAGERVVVEVLQRGRGRASGVVVEGRFWFVFTVAQGRLMRQDMFNERDQALVAAGLRDYR